MNTETKHTPKLAPKCTHCRLGNEADASGNHWIVKSIIPARMVIVKCKDFRAALLKAGG